MQYPNRIEFKVWGDYALFSDPITRIGGEKSTYQAPTYEALKGILASIYWKPTFIWYVDKVRILNPIQTETKGVRTIKYNGGKNDLAYYTYLKDCCYQVQAHFEWNRGREELKSDRNENKHHQCALRMLKKGGSRDIFLGTRECQAYVEPCIFGEGEGAYDQLPQLSWGLMYHGLTYPDEAANERTPENELKPSRLTANFWRPVMERGIIQFLRPSQCPHHKDLGPRSIKSFGGALQEVE